MINLIISKLFFLSQRRIQNIHDIPKFPPEEM